MAKLAQREFQDGYLRRATSEEMCWTELKALGRHGLLGLTLPAQLGGQDADPVTLGIACEQVAKADFNLSYLVFGSELAAAVHAGLASEVADPIVRAVTAGEQVLALALTEPRGGSDASGTTVRARPVEGGYHLTGEKTSVTLGMHASHAIVVATLDPALRSGGTRRLLVALDDPSVGRQRFADPGFRPLSRAAVNFEDTFVPSEYELTGDGSGLGAQLADFDLTRALLGLMVIGAARRAMETTVDWARQREAFGKVIAGYQGVSFPLAEHDTYLEAARWLCYRALGLRAAGLPHSREAAMCKWWIPRVACQAINDCIVLHGHVGWSTEMPLQQLLADVSGLQIGDGTPQIQKLVIARDLIGRDYVG
ncbi:cyclohexanecarboxyl-CoA dehydrogenase [Prauserella muralis]|nr:cyclohexanecarboxyl-CoA dehydrogenase [Prauserella muralis]